MTDTLHDAPPQATEAERALLGACLSGWRHPDDLGIDRSDFYLPAHQAVWDAITDTAAAGNVPDVASVAVATANHKPPIEPTWVFGLTDNAPVAANAPHHAARVRDAAGRRALAEAATTISGIATRPGDLERRREEARNAVDQACRGRDLTKARRIGDLLDDALEAVERGNADRLPTGWPDLDRHIGGLAPGRLVVFGARPGGGKSIAGTNLALHVARRHSHAALVASLEMPEREVINRLVSAHARVNLSDLENGTVAESDWAKIRAAHSEISNLPLWIEDTSNLTVQTLRRLARDIQRERDDLALIVVDYLQLMTPAARRRDSSRAEEVSSLARDLKQLARETGACVVAMAQVNREGGKADHGPRLTDLREGGIENDADQVVLLHRPDEDIPEVTVNVAKNRHGPMGTSHLMMVGHYATLASAAYRGEPS